MTRLFPAAAIAALAVAAACGRAGGHGAESPSPSPSASPTPVTGSIVAHVDCLGPGCITGRLRTVLFDCVTALSIAVDSAGLVTLSSSASITVTFADLAPATDCLHAIVDDTNGGSGVSSADPTVVVISGTAQNVTLTVDTVSG